MILKAQIRLQGVQWEQWGVPAAFAPESPAPAPAWGERLLRWRLLELRALL